MYRQAIMTPNENIITATIGFNQNLDLPTVATVVKSPPQSVVTASLKDDQQSHAEKLLSILDEHKRTIDSSSTGCGKTYVAGYIARTMLDTGKVDNIHVICPPSLVKNWKDVLQKWNVPIAFIHGYNKMHYPHAERSLVILDEFHFLKNASQRYYRTRKLVHKSEYVHATSATPLDNTHQYDHLSLMFGIDVTKIQCRLLFTPPVGQEVEFVTEGKEDEKRIEEYIGGYRKISMSGRLRQLNAGGPPRFNGKLYTKGLHMIHGAMYDHLLELVRTELAQPNRKVIIIEHFRDLVLQLVEDLSESYPDSPPLLLNGSTKQNDRDSIIAQFQEASNRRRILITSAVVGGVGLSLDDQDGNYPRTTIVMPLGNYVDYKQTLGRTLRRNTKSESKVIIVQPNEKVSSTYMKSIITTKGDALDTYLDQAL